MNHDSWRNEYRATTAHDSSEKGRVCGSELRLSLSVRIWVRGARVQIYAVYRLRRALHPMSAQQNIKTHDAALGWVGED
jgi:hypothetical protein